MDVIHNIFDTLDLKGALYFRTDFTPPWAVTVPELGAAARFHVIVQGCCNASFPSGDSVLLNAGDMVLIPGGSSHVLSDPLRTTAPLLENVLEKAGYDGSGVLVIGPGNPQASTQMVCGHLEFRQGADHPLLRALPEYLVISAAQRAASPWLDEMLTLISRRLFSGEFASTAVVTRLSEIVFIELLRSAGEVSENLSSIMQAVRDRQIGRALELIHAQPEHPWTVKQIAEQIGMSRSRFADRFRELLGTGPMSYLSDWRLQIALSLLVKSRSSIGQIAYKTGYQSPAAFSRAFSGKFGVSPREYRQQAA